MEGIKPNTKYIAQSIVKGEGLDSFKSDAKPKLTPDEVGSYLAIAGIVGFVPILILHAIVWLIDTIADYATSDPTAEELARHYKENAVACYQQITDALTKDAHKFIILNKGITLSTPEVEQKANTSDQRGSNQDNRFTIEFDHERKEITLSIPIYLQDTVPRFFVLKQEIKNGSVGVTGYIIKGENKTEEKDKTFTEPKSIEQLCEQLILSSTGNTNRNILNKLNTELGLLHGIYDHFQQKMPGTKIGFEEGKETDSCIIYLTNNLKQLAMLRTIFPINNEIESKVSELNTVCNQILGQASRNQNQDEQKRYQHIAMFLARIPMAIPAIENELTTIYKGYKVFLESNPTSAGQVENYLIYLKNNPILLNTLQTIFSIEQNFERKIEGYLHFCKVAIESTNDQSMKDRYTLTQQALNAIHSTLPTIKKEDELKDIHRIYADFQQKLKSSSTNQANKQSEDFLSYLRSNPRQVATLQTIFPSIQDFHAKLATLRSSGDTDKTHQATLEALELIQLTLPIIVKENEIETNLIDIDIVHLMFQKTADDYTTFLKNHPDELALLKSIFPLNQLSDQKFSEYQEFCTKASSLPVNQKIRYGQVRTKSQKFDNCKAALPQIKQALLNIAAQAGSQESAAL